MKASGDVLLNLYRAARELPIESFQESALGLVKPLLQFESAVWGAGIRLQAGVVVHLAHLHEMPIEYLAEWESLNPQDRVIPAVVADPGRPKLFHSPTLFAGREGSPMLDFTKRAGWQMSMVTAFLVPGQRSAQWMSLYRSDPDHHYSEQEQRIAQFLMPHLVEALTINRALNLQTVYGDHAGPSELLALCDRKGLLHYADPGFVAVLASEWPGFDGGTLPRELLTPCIRDRQPCFTGRSIRVDVRDADEVLFLRARRNSRLDDLSPREREIARQFAQGRSHKEIAKSVGISPATVRHHLSGVYTKLDIHDKAQLAVAMRQWR
jgi:DNA-binding CsgD family transcriptional regulator